MSGKPAAAKGAFPYNGHRTMAEVMRDEARGDWARRPIEYRRLTLDQWGRTARG